MSDVIDVNDGRWKLEHFSAPNFVSERAGDSDSARNLGVIFDKNLSFAQHISSISKSCFLDIHDLRRIRKTIDQTTA